MNNLLQKKIIIAEDSSSIMNLVKKILMLQNYHITPAKNGKQVLELLEESTYDLIIMDVVMPTMSGLDCTLAIRQLPDPVKAGIPIVGISGNIISKSVEDYHNAGFSKFLVKPLDYDLLVSTVNDLLATAV
jgi:CheY-like chemotaxis protein